MSRIVDWTYGCLYVCTIPLSGCMYGRSHYKGGFDEDRNIGDGICDMNMLKQNMRGRNGGIIINPREEQQKLLKILKLTSSCKSE